MTLTMHTTIKVKGGRFADFCSVMSEVKTGVEAAGWKLQGGWTTMIGRLHTVVHVWEIEDGNQVQAGFAHLMTLPNWPDLEKRLGETVEEEVTQLMYPVPYA